MPRCNRSNITVGKWWHGTETRDPAHLISLIEQGYRLSTTVLGNIGVKAREPVENLFVPSRLAAFPFNSLHVVPVTVRDNRLLSVSLSAFLLGGAREHPSIYVFGSGRSEE